jgi:hypothetical protein
MSIRNLSERLNRIERVLKQSPPLEIIVEFVNLKREVVETLVAHLKMSPRRSPARLKVGRG